MYLDFHTHAKLAKKLPFSKEYTNWLFSEARKAGLDALCLTEHFNTLGFAEVYEYIKERAVADGDCLIFDGLVIFPGMEIDIAEGGHVLTIGPVDAILELNRRLEPHKEKENFLPFAQLRNLLDAYPVLVGAGHPFREGGHIPHLPPEQLERFDFFDLNGKDIAEHQNKTVELVFGFGKTYQKPIVGGSDTHQAVQYGCIRNVFDQDIRYITDLLIEMKDRNYDIIVSEHAAFQVKTAGLLKRALKEIHALNGDYVSVLVAKEK